MSPESPDFVLDSHALLSYVFDEPGAAVVEESIAAAARGDCRGSISALNVGEACYIMERRRGREATATLLAALEGLPLRVVDADSRAILGAAHIKAQYPISFADAFVVALALEEGAAVLTGDPEFRRVQHLVTMRWLTL